MMAKPTSVSPLVQALMERISAWEYGTPPGTFEDFVEHPVHADRCLTVGLVQEHRFAFFYWLHRHHDQLVKNPKYERPDLVTIDWHDDVGVPSDFEPELLRSLRINNGAELALFCWAGLRELNDGHILPALALNAFRNVYVIQKQYLKNEPGHEDRKHIFDGVEHCIYYFNTIKQFLDFTGSQRINEVVIDLDLDFFTEELETDGKVKILGNRAVAEVVSPENDFMRWALPRTYQITIATEPEYCGGIADSNTLLNRVNRLLFNGKLMNEWGDD